jgi:hypothetical protein
VPCTCMLNPGCFSVFIFDLCHNIQHILWV